MSAAGVGTVTLQLEPLGDGPRYLTLDGVRLQRYADALRRSLVVLGVARGDTLAFFDFGTSPAVYLAASCYMPYLRRGAAEALGCTTICNDGVATMSERAVDILRYVGPRFLFVRADCLFPLAASCERAGLRVAGRLEAIVVTHDDGPVSPGLLRDGAERLGVPVRRLARCDEALFFAAECAACGCLHAPPRFYDVQIVEPGGEGHIPVRRGAPGLVRVASRFAPERPAVVTSMRARVAPGRCPRGPGDVRLAS